MALTKQSQASTCVLLLPSQMSLPNNHRDSPAPPCSSPVPIGNHNKAACDAFRDAEESLAQRRLLTRQRRLRYLSDHELGISRLNERSRSSPASPESATKLRSPANCGREHWSFSAVPQPLPLPLPESPYIRKSDSMAGRKHIDQISINPSKGSSKSCHIRSNAGDIISCSDAPHNSHHYFNSHAKHEIKPLEPHNLRASCPSKSAPTSPVVSPRRACHRAISELLLGPREFPDMRPRNETRNIIHNARRTHKAFTFHTYKKSLSEEASDANNNSHANAYPLPLPPGAIGVPPCLSPMKGQWKKGKLIGRGTFGSVYLGTNRETGALCAMKEVDLIPDDPKSVESIRQLEQEINVLRQLKHPNIVQYYGSEVVDDHFYIYLEYVHPGSINKFVREHFGAITESVVRHFTRHILSGLAYLHSTKTIHRDIKGANLLVDASGIVKLADFGMAKHLTGQSYDLSLKGSPYWMAPEVIKASMQRNASPYLALAVDIWSLGCTIIEMINGRPPWSEFTGPQAMFNVLNKTPPIPESLSSEGKDFLNCCFRRNPMDRPSAAKLLEHAFVRNFHHQSASPTAHDCSTTNVMDKLVIQKDRGRDKFDFAPMSARARSRLSNGSPPYGGDTSSPWTLSL